MQAIQDQAQPEKGSEQCVDITQSSMAAPEQAKEAKLTFSAAELFEKFEKSRTEKVVFTGQEFAILADLQLVTAWNLSPINNRINDLDGECTNLRNSRDEEIAKMPQVWKVKSDTARQKRIDALSEFDLIEVEANSFSKYGYASHAALPSDPVTAGAMYRVLKKMGHYHLDTTTKIILRSANASELNIISQLLDHVPPVVLAEQQVQFFKGVKEALAGAGTNVSSFKELLNVAKENCKIDPDGPSVIKKGAFSLLPGAFPLLIAQGAAYAAGAVLPPLLIGVLLGIGSYYAYHTFKAIGEIYHPLVNVLESLSKKEVEGELWLSKRLEDDQQFKIKKHSALKVNGAAVQNDDSYYVKTIRDRIDLLSGTTLENHLNLLVEEKEILERTLSIAGYKDLPPTINRTFEILEEMLEKYSQMLKTEGADCEEYAEKIVTSSTSMLEYMRDINNKMKSALEREFSGHSQAIKSILSSIEKLGEEA